MSEAPAKDPYEYVTLYCDVTQRTPKGAMLSRDGESVWVPISRCEVEPKIGDKKVRVQRWVAQGRGLIE
jgi:hypothetical protein